MQPRGHVRDTLAWGWRRRARNRGEHCYCKPLDRGVFERVRIGKHGAVGDDGIGIDVNERTRNVLAHGGAQGRNHRLAGIDGHVADQRQLVFCFVVGFFLWREP